MAETLFHKQQLINLNDSENFSVHFQEGLGKLSALFYSIYRSHPNCKEGFDSLLKIIETTFKQRPSLLKQRDQEKIKTNGAAEKDKWFLSNKLVGMSLYVDRFCKNINGLHQHLDYFEELGVNFLHLMPLFKSPKDESDGGYAVSDFKTVDERFGSLEDLIELQSALQKRNMYLMLDIVLNHTSNQHEWAMKAKAGEKKYQDYYYFFNDRSVPNQLDQTMPEVFPEAAPGNFTFITECNQWVMTVFHQYQWDLNFRNPQVLCEMIENIFFYANLGVDVLRIDAPAFIWKEMGTNCQNLDKAHTILQLIKQAVQMATPGMALLGEAIVAPKEIMKYFGEKENEAKECDFAYHATQMALQWDALATGETKVMMAAQHELLKKPFLTSWITYTRCHDDIGLGYEDAMIHHAGFNPYEHRKFLKEYYTGKFNGSMARGALFSVNEKTGDARICGSLASLCGLEAAITLNDNDQIKTSIQKILLMQAHCFFIGGLPIIFYGDELGYINDYDYLKDDSKNYDNRWMHRPIMDWEKNKKIKDKNSIEYKVFSGTKKLITIRKKLSVIADKKNLTWIDTQNKHIAGFLRAWENERVYCLFNFSAYKQEISWYVFKANGATPKYLFDHWTEKKAEIKMDHEKFSLPPYSFFLMEAL